jgi:hypothetical protein
MIRQRIQAQVKESDKPDWTKYLHPTLDAEQQLDAVRENPMSLKHIKDPFPETVALAISLNGNAIACVKNQTQDQKLVAVSTNPESIKYITSAGGGWKLPEIDGRYIKPADETVRLAAIAKDPDVIKMIAYLSENEQIAAIENRPDVVKYIKHPTPAAQALALSKGVFFFLIKDKDPDVFNKHKATVMAAFAKMLRSTDFDSTTGTYIDELTSIGLTWPEFKMMQKVLHDRKGRHS